jgi:TrmH family RNA methyltransferase
VGKLNIYAAFATENALEKYSDYIDRSLFETDSGRFHTVSENVSRTMSDTVGAQGVFVIAQMAEHGFSEDKFVGGGKLLVLDNLQDPGNVGTILRTADAVGVDGVVMCNSCCDLYNPKTIRSAMGSVFRLNITVAETLDDVCEVFERVGVKTYAAVVDSGARSVTECDFSGSCAAVIGNEGNGLSKEDADVCDEKITIKMQGNINSLNAAMAGGIILWEMFR